ncbi:MAG: hypothetical protein ACREJN_08090 [Nitrospiraceae bacterium]
MAVTHLAPGKIKAILYFQNEKGYIMMLPSDEECLRFRGQMRKLGFEMMAAETLREADKLQKRMQDQLYSEQQMELQRDEMLTGPRRDAVRDRLTAKLNSTATPEMEKDFIRAYLPWRNNKRDIFRKRFTSQIGHLDALEFDNPGKHIHDMLDRIQ